MMERVAAELRRVPRTAASGWNAPIDELVVAALVALPFAGFVGIFVSALLGLSGSMIVVMLSGLLQGALTFWIAGFRRKTEEN
jgi:hypothetical protein